MTPLQALTQLTHINEADKAAARRKMDGLTEEAQWQLIEAMRKWRRSDGPMDGDDDTTTPPQKIIFPTV